MTLPPDRFHRITTHHDRLLTLINHGGTPTHRDVLQLLTDGTDLIHEHINHKGNQ